MRGLQALHGVMWFDTELQSIASYYIDTIVVILSDTGAGPNENLKNLVPFNVKWHKNKKSSLQNYQMNIFPSLLHELQRSSNVFLKTVTISIQIDNAGPVYVIRCSLLTRPICQGLLGSSSGSSAPFQQLIACGVQLSSRQVCLTKTCSWIWSSLFMSGKSPISDTLKLRIS